MAWRNAGTPVIGAYWLWPARIARSSASTRRPGTGKSGKPWPRLTAPCSAASCDITVKMVVPTFGNLLSGTCGRSGRSSAGSGYNEHLFSTIAQPLPVTSRDSDADIQRLLRAYLDAEYRWARDGEWPSLAIGHAAMELEAAFPDAGVFGLLSAWNLHSVERPGKPTAPPTPPCTRPCATAAPTSCPASPRRATAAGANPAG